MEWIDDLEKERWNVVIDELVWHLRHGRMPTRLTRQRVPDDGVEFAFSNLPAVFLPATAPAFDQHWDEAQRIVERYRQLDATCLRCQR